MNNAEEDIQAGQLLVDLPGFSRHPWPTYGLSMAGVDAMRKIAQLSMDVIGLGTRLSGGAQRKMGPWRNYEMKVASLCDSPHALFADFRRMP